jgi:hypothetical protein
MKIKTLLMLCLLLFISTHLTYCAAPKVGNTAATVEEAEAILAKQAKAKQKVAKKAQKKAYKRYWSMQSKEAKKSIKRNKKRQKKLARAKKRA